MYLGVKYCVLQRVHACRRELVVYDRLQLEQSRGGRSGSTAGLASCSRVGPESGTGGSSHAGRVNTCFFYKCVKFISEKKNGKYNLYKLLLRKLGFVATI